MRRPILKAGGVLLVAASACLSSVDFSPVGYGCAVDADCHGPLLCLDRRCVDAPRPTAELVVPLYRLRSATVDSELLTVDPAELRAFEADGGYVSSGLPVARVATLPSAATRAVFALYKESIQDWVYTPNILERDKAVTNYGYTAIGTAFYGASQVPDGGVSVQRWEHDGFHRYPTTEAERAELQALGWMAEFELFGGAAP